MSRRESFRSDDSSELDQFERRYQELSDEVHVRDGGILQPQLQNITLSRPSGMKVVCACLAAVSALSIGVKLLTLPSSSSAAGSATAAAATASAAAVTTLQMDGGEDAMAAAVTVPTDVDVTEQRDIELAKEATEVAEPIDMIPTATNIDEIENEQFFAPLTDLNTAKSAEEHGVYIPPSSSDHYADIWESVGSEDVPLYWDFEHSAGRSVREVLGRCYGFVLAGANIGDQLITEGPLEIAVHESGARYITLDPNHPTGYQQAKKQNLIGSGMADILLTTNLHDMSELYDPMHRGHIFAIFRHPADRAFSRYQEIIASGQISSDVSLLDWIKSNESGNNEIDNPLVRILSNEPYGPLDENHLAAAKEMLRRKIVVGLADKVFESFHRFQQYFGWGTSEDTDHCIQVWEAEEQQNWDATAYAVASNPDRQAAIVALERLHWADLDLHEYARAIYDEQAVLIDEAQILRSEEHHML